MAKVRNEKDRLRKTKPIFVKFDGLWISSESLPGPDPGFTPVGVKKTRQIMQ
jgi:hypothetical protein